MTPPANAPLQTADPVRDTLHMPMANTIRALSMDAVQAANSGHPGMPMGMADVATVLFRHYLKYNPQNPQWPDRDRFILSAGHGSMLLYSLLYLTGYEDVTLDQLKNFRQLHSKCAGHPEYGEAAGIETTTGPLGQGLANSVGFALAEAMMQARYGKELVDHHTYVIAGDGCLMEGISQEAISLAGHLRLGKLVVFWDDNSISIDGPTSLSTSEDQQKRFEAAGWHVQSIDGHDAEAIAAAIEAAQASPLPSMIACKTTIAYGAPTKAGTSGSHGAPLGDEEIAGTRKALGWEHGPFEVPENILTDWRAAGTRSNKAYADWQGRLDGHPLKLEFNHQMAGELPSGWEKALHAFRESTIAEPVKEATRKSSGRVLEKLVPAIPGLIGGSADLTGSNLTKTGDMRPISEDDFSGSYIYYGIREHAMAACMNGMSLHGGVIPYGGTFLIFTDYCRPAIRLSALMKQRVIYVMTHDSIGLGEDGPTHQPVEHLASLRCMPNLNVFRPADAIETAEAWELALATKETPSILALSRQGLPQVRLTASEANLTARGAYILKDSEGEAQVTLIATGSEVHMALEAQQQLQEKHGIAATVVSMPCAELFDRQNEAYQAAILPGGTLKVAIEAAASYGWERYIGRDGIFIGMHSFGASAPADQLYQHFGITVGDVVTAVSKSIS